MTPIEQTPPAEKEVSLLSLVAIPVRHIRLLERFAFAGLAAGLLAAILIPGRYVAESEFLVERPAAASPYAGLAAQFGIAMPGGSMSEAFYVELVELPAILHPAVTTQYEITDRRGTPRRVDLITWFGVENRDSAARVARASRLLADAISADHDVESGLVEVKVRLKNRALAVQVNRRLLDLLNEFNLERRRTRAGEERRFVSERRDSAQRELIAAETRLERFLEQNRSFESSPQLLFESQRLQRMVDLQQQVFASLAQAYEQARIEEVRSTPVITVVTPPESRIRHEGREWILYPLIGLSIGLLGGLLTAMLREFFAFERRNEPARWEDMRAGLRQSYLAGRLVPALRRIRPRRS